MEDRRYAIKLGKEHYPIVEKYLGNPEYSKVLVIGLTTPYSRSNLKRFFNIKNRVEERGGECIGVDYIIGDLLGEYIASKAVEGDVDFLKGLIDPSSIEWLTEDAKEWLEGKLYEHAEDFNYLLMYIYTELKRHPSLYDKIIKEIGIVKDDAKELKTISDNSIDLILAFGLFGELDLTNFQYPRFTSSYYLAKEMAKILETYEERCDKVIKSMHRVLRPKGVSIVSNNNIEKLTDWQRCIEALGYQPEYDQKFYERLFRQNGFSKIEVFNGSESYLMVCEKE